MAESLTLSLLLLTSLLAFVTPSSASAGLRISPLSPPASLAAGVGRVASTAVFPVYGNVYPQGHYYAALAIGDPPKPYFLDVDTGSDLTWLQCDAPCVRCAKGPHPLYRPKRGGLVACADRLCAAVHASTGRKGECEAPTTQCDYEIEYADHWSSLGVLVSDAVALRLANSSLVRPRLGFGCGYDQQGNGATAPSAIDGTLGLGRGKISIVSQLQDQGITRNVIGHCLSRRGGGYLYFGDDLVPSSGVTWAPMSTVASGNYYSPGEAKFSYGKQQLAVKKSQPVVFDSGSSYTYFTTQPYEALLTALKTDLKKQPLKEAVDPELPVCWKGAKPFRSPLDVKMFFASVTMSFTHWWKTAQLIVPPENYLIISKHGNACLGILNGGVIGLKDLNIIGDISMQDHLVVYDNEKHQVGWAPANCDRVPKLRTTEL